MKPEGPYHYKNLNESHNDLVSCVHILNAFNEKKILFSSDAATSPIDNLMRLNFERQR